MIDDITYINGIYSRLSTKYNSTIFILKKRTYIIQSHWFYFILINRIEEVVVEDHAIRKSK